MKKNALLLIILCICIISSCQDKLICPAFQSTYVFDDGERAALFSLFSEDSIPKKKLVVKKNRHGIIVKIRYLKKIENFRTVKMKNIYPEDTAVMALAEQDIVYDSLSGDLKRKVVNKYNTEQVKYMELIGNQLMNAREKQKTEYEKQSKILEEAQLEEELPQKTIMTPKERREEKRQLNEGHDAAPSEEQENR